MGHPSPPSEQGISSHLKSSQIVITGIALIAARLHPLHGEWLSASKIGNNPKDRPSRAVMGGVERSAQALAPVAADDPTFSSYFSSPQPVAKPLVRKAGPNPTAAWGLQSCRPSTDFPNGGAIATEAEI